VKLANAAGCDRGSDFGENILMRTALQATILLLFATSSATAADKPLALHPDNPHYGGAKKLASPPYQKDICADERFDEPEA
jgi:hypothetical protein